MILGQGPARARAGVPARKNGDLDRNAGKNTASGVQVSPRSEMKTDRSVLGSAGWVGATGAALADPSSLCSADAGRFDLSRKLVEQASGKAFDDEYEHERDSLRRFAGSTRIEIGEFREAEKGTAVGCRVGASSGGLAGCRGCPEARGGQQARPCETRGHSRCHTAATFERDESSSRVRAEPRP